MPYTKPLIDTNILYALVDPHDVETPLFKRLMINHGMFISDVSVMEWVIRNGNPTTGNLEILKKGLSYIDGKNIKQIPSPYLPLNETEVLPFRACSTLLDQKTLHQNLVERRIEVEFSFLNWILISSIASYISHVAHELVPESSPLAGKAAQLAEAILAANMGETSTLMKQGIIDSYQEGNMDRGISDLVNDLRLPYITATRIAFTELLGGQLTSRQIDETLNLDRFRKFIIKQAKLGRFANFYRDIKNDMKTQGQGHELVIQHLFNRLDEITTRGSNYKKNDVNDAFIMWHQADPTIEILTRDEGMISGLSVPPFRPAANVSNMLLSLGL